MTSPSVSGGMVGVGSGVGLGEGEGVGVGDGVGLGDGVGVGDGVGLGEGEGVGVGEGVAVGLGLGAGLATTALGSGECVPPTTGGGLSPPNVPANQTTTISPRPPTSTAASQSRDAVVDGGRRSEPRRTMPVWRSALFALACRPERREVGLWPVIGTAAYRDG
jgi:hypothetical protein